MVGFLRLQNFRTNGNGLTLTAGITSSNVAYPILIRPPFSHSTTMVTNAGTVNVAIAFGQDNTVTAAFPSVGVPANGMVVLAGETMPLDDRYALWVAAIATSGTASVYFYKGEGN